MSTVGYHINYSDLEGINKTRDTSRIYIGEVMDTRSPIKNGDIKVWLLSSGTIKEDPKNWITARCGCGIFGNTITSSKEDIKKDFEYNSQNTSFGNWLTIPYVGNHVFIFFPCISGENTIAYWFGSPMISSNEMLPGISYDLTQSNNYEAKCEKNYKNPEVLESKEYSPLQKALEVQGLNQDRLRGISTASSFRDTPSHCYGFLSPLGNQMVIDDGWSTGDANINWINNPRVNNKDNEGKDDYGVYHSKKEWVASLDKSDKDNKLNRFHGGFRFRTRNGTQLLILDTGNIYMINKDGSAWVELSEDGYIDCYSAFGISASSEGEINLHANKINIEAEDTITLNAKKSLILNSSGNINAISGVFSASTKISTPSIVASSGIINSLSSGNANLTGVFSGTLQGTAFYATAAGQVPIEQPMPQNPSAELNDVVYPDYYDVEQTIGENPVASVTTRMPCHEPWEGHDKNDCIPPLIVKQVMEKEEKEKVNNTVPSNQVRR